MTMKYYEDINVIDIDKTDGYFDDGISYNPNGVWCGECITGTCHGCLYEHETEERFAIDKNGHITIKE